MGFQQYVLWRRMKTGGWWCCFRLALKQIIWKVWWLLTSYILRFEDHQVKSTCIHSLSCQMLLKVFRYITPPGNWHVPSQGTLEDNCPVPVWWDMYPFYQMVDGYPPVRTRIYPWVDQAKGDWQKRQNGSVKTRSDTSCRSPWWVSDEPGPTIKMRGWWGYVIKKRSSSTWLSSFSWNIFGKICSSLHISH